MVDHAVVSKENMGKMKVENYIIHSTDTIWKSLSHKFKYPSTFSQAAYDKDKGVDGKRKESPAKKEVGGSVKKQKKLDFVKK